MKSINEQGVPVLPRISEPSLITALGALLGSALLAACAASQPGATDANLAAAKSRASQGAALYESSCAVCHGPRGEGLAGAPLIIGINALPRYPRDQSGLQQYMDSALTQRQNQQRVPGAASRVEFVTAHDLFDYLKVHVTMIDRQAGAPELKEPDLWALVNFMLIAHGSEVPAEITPANARDVQIRAQ